VPDGWIVPLLTAVQAWRFACFGFLALFAYGVLLAVLAWPAGLGDMANGFTEEKLSSVRGHHVGAKLGARSADPSNR
jgi:hypothetical protein